MPSSSDRLAPRARLLLAGAAVTSLAALPLLSGCTEPGAVPEATDPSWFEVHVGPSSELPHMSYDGGYFPSEDWGSPQPRFGDDLEWTEPPRESPIVAECADAPLAFGFSTIEAATGKRYFAIEIRNCTDAPIDVSGPPQLTALDLLDRPVSLELELRADEAPLTITPRGSGYLQLKWYSNGTCTRGAVVLTLTIGDSSDGVRDCFQLGNPEEDDFTDPLVSWRWSESPAMA